MGISKSMIRLIARSLRDRQAGGKVLTFGKSGVEGNHAEALRILSEEQYPVASIRPEDVRYDSLTQVGRTIHQDTLFRLLGFSDIHSIDKFPNEEPTYVLDLNHPLPPGFHGQYALVMDAGTTEHCFDIRQVLENVVLALRPGGQVGHIVPMTGWTNHGFYSFSPTLFQDYYHSNGFADLATTVIYYRGLLGQAHCFRLLPEHEGLIANFPYRSLIFFTARKQESGDRRVIPVQSCYLSRKGHQPSPLESYPPAAARLIERIVHTLGAEAAASLYVRARGLRTTLLGIRGSSRLRR